MEEDNIFTLVGVLGFAVAVIALLLFLTVNSYTFYEGQFVVNNSNISINTSWISTAITNVNNSNFLEGHPSSYFYPFSNPLNFINTTPDLSGLIPKVYGVSSSSASTNSKSVTIADYTPVAGDIIAIKFTYGSITTQKWNLAINGVWYYDIYVGGSTTTADYLLFSANAVVLFYYDGTRINVVNPTYTNPLKWITLADTNERPVETIYGYKLAWKDGNNRYRPIIKTSGTTGNNKMPNTVGFMLGSNMVTNPTGTTYGTSSTMAKNFNLIGDIGGAYNFNGAFTLWLPVYFKGTVNQTNGLFYFNQANGYTGWYTQTLPTSEDGFVYVYVGNAQSAYGVGLSLNHPAYEFKDGMIRLYGEAKNTHQDNFKEYFGSGNDASIYYDGTDLNINTKEVGSGTIKINGVGAFSGTFITGDGKTVTVTDGIITSVV